MDHYDAIDVLSTLPAFRHLDDHDLEIIAASSTLVTCGSATVLVSPGGRPDDDPTSRIGAAPGRDEPRPHHPTDEQRTLLRRLMHT